jgi:hypothetical protein
MAEIHVMTWDYRQQPDMDQLGKHVYNISCTGRPVWIQEIDTGSQDYAVTIADVHLTEHEQQEALEAYENGER